MGTSCAKKAYHRPSIDPVDANNVRTHGVIHCDRIADARTTFSDGALSPTYDAAMVESGLPYDRDSAITDEDIDDPYTPQPRHTAWFRHNDEMLAKMQEHVRGTPGCRAISVFLAGTGFGGADYELI